MPIFVWSKQLSDDEKSKKMAFLNLKYYYNRTSGTIAPASHFVTKPHTDPKNFFCMGSFGPTQNPPYIKGGKVFRLLYGKEVLQATLTSYFEKWLEQ